MTEDIQVSASILCADFTKLGEEVKKCEAAGVDMLHVDVMDGHFVPNITVGKMIVEAIRPITELPIEAHLMIENPWRYIDDFINAGTDIISLHAECYGPRREACREPDQYPKEIDTIDVEKARKDIVRIKDKGRKAFMVLNPGTPLCLGDLLNDLDGVLVMSVHPGFAKQKFMPEVLSKVRELSRTFEGDIAIDGGIKDSTAPSAVEAGANILATASYFFGAEDPQEAVKQLKSLQRI
ncbi:MAG: ribulose-phosphate 3-epimerase [Candidatus Omnitrophica bacterium]|nr:ribulose-phosphate 3-epimerase [Candidatus Omnitrophota bacterium]